MTPTKLIIIIISMIMTIASNAQNMVSLAEVCDAVIEKGMKYVVLEDYKGVVFTQGMAELGVAFAGKTPACHVRCIKERKEDIAWENDRVSFRIYSREVKGKVSSGVDFWTKNVAHPVVEAWYALNDKGMDYHTDRGEGYDFYAVGRNRGVGGTGIMSAAGLVAPEPYANYRIYNDTPDLVDFEISYQLYEADCRTYRLRSRIGGKVC